MGLKEQLMEDFKSAMKAHDDVSKKTISMARAAIKQYEIDNREELDDSGVIAVLQKQVKLRKDALADFAEANRTDLVESYNNEIAVLEKYLPEQMSENEIREVVKETAEVLNVEKSGKSMGKLMGPVMKKLKGRADGNTVRKVVTEFLSE